MKFKTTVILLVVFLALLAFVLFYESGSKGKKTEEAKLVGLSSDDVMKIVLKREDGSITFIKDEKGEWTITEPVEAKADTFEVKRLAEDFSNLKIERVVEEEPENTDEYEISTQEISLWFKSREEPVRILIGGRNPLDNTLFAKREDEKRVVLIAGYLKTNLDKTILDFRKKDIFNFDTAEVKGIKLRAQEVQWQAARKDDEWFFERPVAALARKSRIETILSSLSHLRAKEFVSEEKTAKNIARLGLDKPGYEVSLTMPLADREIRFFLCKEGDQVYATTSLSNKIVAVDDAILSDLEKEVEELREKEAASFYSWEVDRLFLRRGEMSLTVFKDKDDKWRFESDDKEEADGSKIETFIRKIDGLEAVEFIDPPFNLGDHGLENPQGEIRIRTGEGGEKEKEIIILIGAEDREKNQVVVKNARLDYLFRVDSGFLEDFPAEPGEWKKKDQED